jgi:DUF4097 and DUF4098 domain-containing protein YvlB
MISRSILIGALVVVELAIVGSAFRALGAGAPTHPRHPFGFGNAAGFGTASAATTKLDRTFGTDHQGDLELSTTDGRIELTDVRAGSVGARTGEGRLTLRRVAAEHLEASTGDGRLDAADVRLSLGALTTGSGRIRLAFSPDSDATVTVHTGEGQIDVPSGIAATVSDSGDEVHERVLRLGLGRGIVRISSGDGSISITQGAQV